MYEETGGKDVDMLSLLPRGSSSGVMGRVMDVAIQSLNGSKLCVRGRTIHDKGNVSSLGPRLFRICRKKLMVIALVSRVEAILYVYWDGNWNTYCYKL